MGPRSRARWQQARDDAIQLGLRGEILARYARVSGLSARSRISQPLSLNSAVCTWRLYKSSSPAGARPYPQTRDNSIPIFTSLLKIGLFITLRFAVRSILHLLSLCCNVSFTTIQHCRKLICFAATSSIQSVKRTYSFTTSYKIYNNH